MRAAVIIQLPRRGNKNLRAHVKEALSAIDSVHTIPELPELPVAFTEKEQYGGYIPEMENRPRSLEISTLGPTPRLTFVHEFGHFLDNALGGFQVYSTE